MKKMKKGFTLIELLVVIAIIGILAAMVLVSLNSARTKAKATRVIGDMSELRNTAEVFYSISSTYTGFAVNSLIAADITKQGVGPITLDVQTGTGAGASYSASVSLPATPAATICVDSSGRTTDGTATLGNNTASICSGAQR